LTLTDQFITERRYLKNVRKDGCVVRKLLQESVAQHHEDQAHNNPPPNRTLILDVAHRGGERKVAERLVEKLKKAMGY
jgi:hypothetical protein